MKLKTSKNATETARAVLPKLAQKYFKAGRETLEGKRSPKEMHRFRIATKRFRYSLELFRPVYGPSLEGQLDSLRKLQNALGDLSDYHTMHQIFSNDKSLQAKLERAIKRKLKEFEQRWQEFGSDWQLRRWKSYLSTGRPTVARK